MNGWDKIPGKDFFFAVSRLFEILGQYAKLVIESILSNEIQTRKMAASMIHHLFVQNNEQKRAMEIMDRNFYSIGDCVRLLGYIPTPEEISDLKYLPFPEETLIRHRRTHILFPRFNTSIHYMFETLGLKDCFSRRTDQNKLIAFDSHNSHKASWELIAVKDFDRFINQSFNTQKERLGIEVEILSAQAVVYILLVHFLATKEKLLPDLIFRVRDEVGRIHHQTISFTDGGITIAESWDYEQSPELVIATGIKKPIR
jgi:hypothetical protein